MILAKLIKWWWSRRISKHNVCKMMGTFEEFGFDAMLFAVHPDFPDAKVGIISSGDNPYDAYLPTRRLLKELKKELRTAGVDFDYTIKLAEGKKKK